MALKPKGFSKRTFTSLREFEKAYFPISYKAKMEEEQHNKPGAFGAKLASKFLEDIGRKIAK